MTKTNDEQLTDIAKMLKAAGWRDTCDAQWDGLKAIIPHLARELGAAVEPGERRCGFVGMYDIPCGLNAGHEGAHRVYGPHTKLSKTTAGDELNGESNPRAGASVSQPSPAVGPSEKS